MKRKLLGDEHPAVAFTLGNLAVLLKEKGEYEEAEQLLRQSIAMNRKLLGDEHPDLAWDLNSLALLLVKNGDCIGAVQLFREAIEIRLKTLPGGHWITSRTKSNLGKCLTKLKSFQEAESLLLECYMNLKEERGKSDKFTLETLNRIIALYKAWDKPEKVAEYEALLPDSTAVSETQ